MSKLVFLLLLLLSVESFAAVFSPGLEGGIRAKRQDDGYSFGSSYGAGWINQGYNGYPEYAPAPAPAAPASDWAANIDPENFWGCTYGR